MGYCWLTKDYNFHATKLFSREIYLYKSHKEVIIQIKLHPFPRHMMCRFEEKVNERGKQQLQQSPSAAKIPARLHCQSSAKQSPFLKGHCTQFSTQRSYCKSLLVSFITYGACFGSDPVLICDTRLLYRAAGERHTSYCHHVSNQTAPPVTVSLV